jgi:hypothetical protein
MLVDVTEVKVIALHRLHLRFEDGVEGEVDVAALTGLRGIFAPLADTEFFGHVTIHPELGTIVWPNGADLDPVVLYSQATGQRPEAVLALEADRPSQRNTATISGS